MDTLRKLYIEPTSHCNLDCKMCFRHTWFDESFCDLELNHFIGVMNSLPEGVETIFFGGMGEPLYHKEILEMIKIAKEKVGNVEAITNGTLLDEEMINALFDLKLDKLWISLDSLTDGWINEEGHDRSTSIFDTLTLFNKIRFFRSANTKLGVTFVATKSNVAELENFPYFIEKYQISDVNISNIYPMDKKSYDESLYKKTVSMSTASDKFGPSRPTVNMPYMDFDNANVQKGVNGMFSRMNFNLKVGLIPVPRRSQYCRFVEEGNAFVRADGEVSPCMALLHNGYTVLGDTERKMYHHSFGNIKNSGIKEIWESNLYSDFRKRVIEFSFPPCLNCGHCEYPESNLEDCFGNEKPTCGACLWADGLIFCP